jgi:iron complex outermembrane receptor protein
MRGFPTYEDGIMYNGIRGNIYLYHQNAPLWNIESVDIVRGPASALFSAGSPGGIINMNTKQPQKENKYSFNYSFGSWNTHDVSVDATGSLSKDKKFRYRFVAGYLDKKSFRDFYHRQILSVMPTLAYHFSDKTNLTLEYIFSHQKDVLAYDRGTFVTKNANGSYNWNDIDISFNHGSPIDWGKDYHHSASLTFNHQVNDKLKLTVMSRYIHNKLDMAEHYGDYGGDPERTDTLLRRWDNWHWRPYNFQTSAFASYKTGNGFIQHTILAGFDVSLYGNTRNNYIDGMANPFVDAYNADYSKDNWSSYPLANDASYFYEDDIQKYRLLGGYIQDQVSIGKKIKVLLSGRYDDYYSTNTPASVLNYTPDADTSVAHTFLPRIGVVYQPKENIAFYSSYTESFLPQYSNNARAGGPFPPQKGVQYEIGYKGDFLGNRLSTMIAVYTLTYKNVLALDPGDPTGLRQIPVSGVRSNGAELTVQGNLKNISAIIGYAYNDTKLLETSTIGNKGDYYANAPKNVANLWLKYDFTLKSLRGLGLGLGMKYVDERIGVSYDQNFVIPAYTLIEAMITYRFRNFTLTANAYNIGNKKYIYGGYYSIRLGLPGDPRNFRMGISYSF